MRERVRTWATLRNLHSMRSPMVDDQLGQRGDAGDYRYGFGGL